MGHYAEWQQIVTKVLELISKNEKLLKLAYDSSDNPYAITTPSWKNVLMRNVFPMPKEPDSVSDQKSFINVYMYRADFTDEISPYFRGDFLCIEVGSHLNSWMLKDGEIRPYTMLNLIDEMLGNKKIESMSIQKVLPQTTKVLKFGDMFYGYRTFYYLTNTGGVNCG